MNWSEIRAEWEASDITLKALADKHGVKATTMRSRKNREAWQRNATPSVATKKKKPADGGARKESGLNDKQRLFCIYYLKHFNATKAYQKAYEVDYLSAMSAGSRLMRNVKVSDEIDRLKEEQARGLKLDAEAVLQKYIDIAFADITDFVGFGQREIKSLNEHTGEIETITTNKVLLKESSEVDGTIVTGVKKGKDGVSIKLADKMKALEFLTKYTDLLSNSDREKLQNEKLRADTELTRERAKLIKGEEKDLSLLKELLRVSGFGK